MHKLKKWQVEEIRKLLGVKKRGRKLEIVLVNEIQFRAEGLNHPENLIDEILHCITEDIEDRRIDIEMLLECETKTEWLDVQL